MSTISCESDETKAKAWKDDKFKNFPAVLYEMLQQCDDDGCNDIVSWKSHGKSFCVHDVDQFVEMILPK